MTENIKPNPCPFCGHLPGSYRLESEYRPRHKNGKTKGKRAKLYEKVIRVICVGCKTLGPQVDTWNHDKANKAWNTRHAPK